MTGIDDPYESPENPEVHLKSAEQTPDVLADQVIAYLESAEILSEKL
ncbi:MAG: adenylyl-sulfate kinase [Planctomycetota bacterium]|nr:adenylyl-sulfate kinase [Planctomycetota bacterium]